MTPAALAAIEARLKELKPEPPWQYQEGADVYTHIVRAGRTFILQLPQGSGGAHERIGRFIANAPSDLAALLAHIRSLEAEREAEIAAAVARERERCARQALAWGATHACAEAIRALANIPATAIREGR